VRLLGSNAPLARLTVAFLAIGVAEYGQWITVVVYAYDHGGTSTAGLVALAQLAPSMILAPLISAHGVRIGMPRLLAGSYLIATLSLGLCGAAMLLAAPPVLVYLAAVCFTVALGVAIPLHNALIPLVVRHPDELTAGNVSTGWCKGSASLLGPAAAGVLIATDGPGLACVVLAAICSGTALLANVVPVRASTGGAAPDRESPLTHIYRAARVIGSRPSTRDLIAYRSAGAAVEGAVGILGVILAVQVLALGSGAAGYLNAAFGAGGAIGAAIAVLLVGRRLAFPLMLAAIGGGAALAALSLVSSTVIALALLVVVGISRSVQSVAAQTLLQRLTPLDVMVCAFALVESVRDAGLALGALAVPVLVSVGGPDAAFIGVGCLAPLVAVLTFHRVRTVDRAASIPVVEMGVLRNLPIFTSLPPAPLETLAREASYLTVNTGATIVREGEEGETYYVVTDGEVTVTQGGSEIRRLQRGEGFGEIALLHSINRTATVAATVDTTLLGIGQDAFLTALNASPDAHEAAHRLSRRLREREAA
jgi:hypothetical protein